MNMITSHHPVFFPDRKTHLRYLLLDLPTQIIKKQATISGLARSLGISRITASGFFNTEQDQFPLSLKMAVRLSLATREYLPAISSPTTSILYPVTPEDWLKLDKWYKVPSTVQMVRQYDDELRGKVRILAAIDPPATVIDPK